MVNADSTTRKGEKKAKKVDLGLSEAEQERATDLHEKATIINMLSGCAGWQSKWKEFGKNRAVNFIENGLQGNCHANSLTLFGHDIGQAALSITKWDKYMAEIPEKAKKITSAADIKAAKDAGKVGYIINFQNTTMLGRDLAPLDLLHKLGTRVIQLTYQRANLVGDGCGSRRAEEAGLTDFGLQVVERMNDLNIVIDLSHVGYATTMETLACSDQPPAFTHTQCDGVWDFMRGKSDEELKTLAEKGGVMGVTAIARFLREQGDLEGATIEHFLDHIDYAVDLMGVDHVGLGLDINEGLTPEEYYGIHNQNYEARFQSDPTSHTRRKHPYEHYYVFGLDSIAKVQYVTRGLISRGYSDQEILKILGGNWLRYLERVWGE